MEKGVRYCHTDDRGPETEHRYEFFRGGHIPFSALWVRDSVSKKRKQKRKETTVRGQSKPNLNS
eukprot:snap_masked-scaffold_3-processed-gene-0.27-mRNA-1 protein AED:1.00 eAED:1.00 QI:0/-1/0/0/-1/1/1/0/63